MSKAQAGTPLKIIPLGGVSEAGKNCTLVQYGNDMVLIDAGVQFPNEDMLGVDLVIPDVSYVRQHLAGLHGIVLTHGHEDHMGALAYVVAELNAEQPIRIYGTPLSLGLARARLEERRALHRVDLCQIDPGGTLSLGWADLEFVPVGHSIPDAVAVAIHSPVGTVLYTGDWKFADMPPEGIERLRQLGDAGVLALLADCVRIESPGRTPPESTVADALEGIMRQAPGRVIVTTFASNIYRVAEVIRRAHRLGRASCLVGRSMERNISVAQELGYLNLPEGALVTVEAMRDWDPTRVLLITTGSQGEPAAALSRIAAGEHRQIRIIAGDTVVMAATPVPGNEESVSKTIDNLFRGGADVLYPRTTPNIHVSGHAAHDEHGELLDIVRPQFAAPFHGEYRMMVLYRRVAMEHGLPREHVLMPELGDVMEFRADSARVHGKVPAGSILVDGITVGAVTQVMLRDRRHLAADGIVVVSAVVDGHTGRPISDPELLTRGLPHSAESGLMEGARAKVLRVLQRRHLGEVEHRLLGDLIKENLGAYIYQQTGLRPMILPVVTEI